MDHELVGGGDEVAAAGNPFLAGADDLGRADVEAEGEAGDGAVVGDGDLAAEGLEGAGSTVGGGPANSTRSASVVLVSAFVTPP